MNEDGNYFEPAFGEQMFTTQVFTTRATRVRELQERASPLITIYFQITIFESSQRGGIGPELPQPKAIGRVQRRQMLVSVYTYSQVLMSTYNSYQYLYVFVNTYQDYAHSAL